MINKVFVVSVYEYTLITTVYSCADKTEPNALFLYLFKESYNP